MKINKSLNIKIGFYFLVINFILVSLLGSIFYFSSSNLLIKETISNVSESMEKNGNYIEIYVNKLTSLSEIISKDSSVHTYFQNEKNSKLALKEKRRILQLIDNIIYTDKYIKSIILIGKNGKIISNEKNIDMKISNDMMKEEWYLNSLKSSMPILIPLRKQNFFKDNLNDWVISVSKEIKDKEGKHLGVLLIDVKYQVLHDFLKSCELIEDGDSIILDKNGKVVYYKDISCIESDGTCLKKFENTKESYNRNKNILIKKYPIKNTNWYLLNVSYLKEVKSLKYHFIELIVLSSLLSFLITLLINIFVLKKITRPLKQLEKHMRNFSTNLEKINLDGDISEEIKSLQNYFNLMIDKINYLREYEINALHSQINPHFLYNTLDTIIWAAEFEDTEKVISITKSLANFFRISLSNGKEKILLQDEINHIKEYLYIQKQRYEEKLTYEIKIDSKLQNLEIPKIILQPLVENAIYHGIKNQEKVGKIKIYSRIEGNKINLVVEDNGIGFEESERQKKSKNLKIGGIGIKNVNKRIQFYYGKEYGVFIDKRFIGGARLVISLPYYELNKGGIKN